MSFESKLLEKIQNGYQRTAWGNFMNLGSSDSSNSQVFPLPSLMKIQNGYQRTAWGSFMNKVQVTVQIHQRLLISEYLYWVTSFRFLIHDHTLKATQMTMTDYYYKQKYKRLKRNNKCFIWSKMFLISVFLWCVTSSSNLFWTFDHKLDTALPPKSPNDHQFRFH